jgi:hypothetical protein
MLIIGRRALSAASNVMRRIQVLHEHLEKPTTSSCVQSFRGLASATEQIDSKFQTVTTTVGPKIAASGTNDQKLRAYALFKQATVGDASGCVMLLLSGSSTRRGYSPIVQIEAWHDGFCSTRKV